MPHDRLANSRSFEVIGVLPPEAGFVGDAAAGAAVVFGLAPALQSSRVTPGGALRASASRSTSAFQKPRSMSLLVAGEVTMALTLLIVAGLGIRDLIQLQRLDPGFQTEQILTYSIGLPSVRYDDEESLNALGSAPTDRLFPGHALHHYRP